MNGQSGQRLQAFGDDWKTDSDDEESEKYPSLIK
jgi:hypothetical protein